MCLRGFALVYVSSPDHPGEHLSVNSDALFGLKDRNRLQGQNTSYFFLEVVRSRESDYRRQESYFVRKMRRRRIRAKALFTAFGIRTDLNFVEAIAVGGMSGQGPTQYSPIDLSQVTVPSVFVQPTGGAAKETASAGFVESPSLACRAYDDPSAIKQ